MPGSHRAGQGAAPVRQAARHPERGGGGGGAAGRSRGAPGPGARAAVWQGGSAEAGRGRRGGVSSASVRTLGSGAERRRGCTLRVGAGVEGGVGRRALRAPPRRRGAWQPAAPPQVEQVGAGSRRRRGGCDGTRTSISPGPSRQRRSKSVSRALTSEGRRGGSKSRGECSALCSD